MSQQELMPEPQSQNEQKSGNDEDRDIAQPYYWSTQPKEEPASGHDESLTQNDYAGGYQPQNETVYSYPENNSSAGAASDFEQPGQSGRSQGQQQQQQFQNQQGSNPYAPDGDTFESGYNSYNQYNPYNAYNADNNWQAQQSVPPWARPQRSRGGFRWIWIVLLVLLFIGPMMRFIGAAIAVVFPLLFIGLIIFASVIFWSTIGPRRRGPWGW